MNIKKLLFIALIVPSLIGYAQTADNKYAVGLNLVKNEYNGDYGNGIFDFNKKFYTGAGLFFTKYMSPSFDVGLQTSYGSYGYFVDDINNFSGGKFDASLFAHYKLNNGYFFNENINVSPFISVGLGFANYFTTNDAKPWPTIITNDADFIIPLGAGLKFRLSNTLSLQYQYLYTITNADVRDQNRSGGIVNTVFGTPSHPLSNPGNDAYGQHLLGLVINFNKPKDADKDGVPDIYDECPATPRHVKVDEDGCPVDTDKDGVPDYLDKCYNTPRMVTVDKDGCPLDTDKDGIPDYMDQ